MAKPTNLQELIDSRKALPSSPIWSSLQMSWSTWATDRYKLWTMMAIYQKNDVVHGAISLLANAVCAANPVVCKKVNKGAKRLQERGLKRIPVNRIKALNASWSALNRKAIEEDIELVESEHDDFTFALNNQALNEMSQGDLIRLTTVNLCIYGIAFLHKLRAGNGQTIGYEHIPSFEMIPNRGGDGTIISWFFSPLWGEHISKTEIRTEDLLIFRNPSTTDPVAGGDSPLLSALAKLELSGKWLDWQSWLVGNRARPDWVFIPKLPAGTTLVQDQIDRAEKKANDKFRGAGNGRVAVMDSDGSAIPLNFTPTDMAPLEFDKNLQQAVFWALHIPKAMTSDEANRANSEAAHEQFARYSLAPVVSIIEHVMSKEAADEHDSTLIYAFENVVPPDEEQQLAEETFSLSKWNQGLTSGAVTVDEWREQVLGLGPKPVEETPEEVTPVPPVDQADADEANDQEEVEEEPTPEKGFDLLMLNLKVSSGEIDRATAISIAAFSLKIDESIARTLVTKRELKEEPKPVEEVVTEPIEVVTEVQQETLNV